MPIVSCHGAGGAIVEGGDRVAEVAGVGRGVAGGRVCGGGGRGGGRDLRPPVHSNLGRLVSNPVALGCGHAFCLGGRPFPLLHFHPLSAEQSTPARLYPRYSPYDPPAGGWLHALRTQDLESGYPVVQRTRPLWCPKDVGAIDEGVDAELQGMQLGDADRTNAGDGKPKGLAPKTPQVVLVRRNQDGHPLELPAAQLIQFALHERVRRRRGKWQLFGL